MQLHIPHRLDKQPESLLRIFQQGATRDDNFPLAVPDAASDQPAVAELAHLDRSGVGLPVEIEVSSV